MVVKTKKSETNAGILPLLPEDLREHMAQIFNLSLEWNSKIVR